MHINGITPISLLDYPDKICSIIFTSPCNFRCPFCHNIELIEKNENLYEVDYILKEIDKRKNFIDAVVITGGEPTLQKDLKDFIKKIKKFNLKVKIDTNGYMPEVIEDLLKDELIDYISMDIKTSFEKYPIACGRNIDIERIQKTIDIIKNSKIDYNFRTTCVPKIVEENDIENISKIIKGAKLYVLQQFNNEKTFDESFKFIIPYNEEKIKNFYDVAIKYVEKVKIENMAKVF